jgi:hypothetical protein
MPKQDLTNSADAIVLPMNSAPEFMPKGGEAAPTVCSNRLAMRVWGRHALH